MANILALPDESVVFPASVLLLEQQLQRTEQHTETALRMQHVLDLHLAHFKQQWPTLTSLVAAQQVLKDSLQTWSPEQIVEWLITVAWVVPFAPYEPGEIKDRTLEAAVTHLATGYALSPKQVGAVYQVKRDVRTVFHSSQKLAWGLGLGGVALLGLALPIAVPFIGAAAGLSGAAATVAGIATLGGGAVATGGLGMVGGLAAIGVAGTATGIGGSLALKATLQQISVPLAFIEDDLERRMARWQLVVLNLKHDLPAARREIAALQKEIDQISQQIDTELEYSSPKSSRVQELQRRTRALMKTITWMEKRIRTYEAEKQKSDGNHYASL